jgi:phosphate/phosphite/phosphonate ABC transporter binding protein
MTTPHPGQIGRYTVLERLAVGGMAVVYLGFEQGDTGLQRLVVIKQILPQHGGEDSFRRMFIQEARLAARINHPNVVEIHELGEYEGHPFIAMEYVPGVPLNVLARTARDNDVPIPTGVATGIMLQACAGAHAAHELQDPSGEPANLVHRDLTPHNLIVTETGLVKVLDFGVAKAASNPEQTQTGLLKGKLPYMSPEQLWQADLDRRSDVFTLGAVLWEMFLGKRLFARDTEVATVNAVLSAGIPSLSAIRDDVPTGVQAVAMLALAKKPDERPQSADAFRRSLSAAAQAAQIDTSQDAIAEFVSSLMSTFLDQRRSEVNSRVEKSLLTVPSPMLFQSSGPTAATLHVPRKKPGTWTGMAIGAAGTGLFGVLCVVGLIWTDILRTPDETLAASPVAPAGEEIQILIAPTMDPDILTTELEPLRAYLARYLARPVRWSIAQTYGETGDRVAAGEVAFASLPPNLYIQTHDAHPKVRLVAVKIHAGSHGSDGVLVVRESEAVATVEDLRGKNICYTDPDSTTGYILPRATLRRHGIDPDRDMGDALVSGNHLQMMRDLMDGRCDVGGTFTAAYTTADEAGVNVAKLRVLAITGRTPHDAICAGPTTSLELEAKMRQALLDFDPQRDVGMAQLGSIERLTGFAPVTDSVYDDLRTALAAERAAIDSQ